MATYCHCSTCEFSAAETNETRLPADCKKMVVLKGVPRILSPELIYVLAQMGHGDEIGEWAAVPWKLGFAKFSKRNLGKV